MFLSANNECQGKHLANLTKIAHDRLKECDNLFAEWRISVLGSSNDEWFNMANFMINNNLHDLSNNKWMVQNPRVYSACRKGDSWCTGVHSYSDILDNFFRPLFEATLHPEKEENINLAFFLKHLSGFDSVNDESNVDAELRIIYPHKWNTEDNPSYTYQLYFFWVNIFVLNRLRESLGLNVFSFRPHCGESGDVMHLVTGYLLSNGIAHGIGLKDNAPLQYLYYLDQIGIHVSPSR